MLYILQVFNSKNTLVKMFGCKGTGLGEFDYPYGVGIDPENNIVVADMWNNRVSLYMQDGTFIRHLIADTRDSIQWPAQLCIGKNDPSTDAYMIFVNNLVGSSLVLYEF